MIQLKKKTFLRIALKFLELVQNIKNRYKYTDKKEKGKDVKYTRKIVEMRAEKIKSKK